MFISPSLEKKKSIVNIRDQPSFFLQTLINNFFMIMIKNKNHKRERDRSDYRTI